MEPPPGTAGQHETVLISRALLDARVGPVHVSAELCPPVMSDEHPTLAPSAVVDARELRERTRRGSGEAGVLEGAMRSPATYVVELPFSGDRTRIVSIRIHVRDLPPRALAGAASPRIVIVGPPDREENRPAEHTLVPATPAGTTACLDVPAPARFFDPTFGVLRLRIEASGPDASSVIVPAVRVEVQAIVAGEGPGR
jgi:hypothetical protein